MVERWNAQVVLYSVNPSKMSLIEENETNSQSLVVYTWLNINIQVNMLYNM